MTQRWRVGLGLIVVLLSGTTIPLEGGNRVVAVALEGDAAPGAGTATFSSFHKLAINESGAVVFVATVEGVEDECGTGIWSGVPGRLELVACSGQPAPDTEDGTVFVLPGSGLFGGLIDGDGNVAFDSRLEGESTSLFDDEGVWLGPAIGPRLVAREGDQAPGTPTGVRFLGMTSSQLVLNDVGIAAFFSNLTGPDVSHSNDRGLWVGSNPDNLRLVAREGDPAPGAASGVVIRAFSTTARALNDRSSIVFRATVDGTDVDQLNDAGIWMWREGALELVLRKGDPHPGAPGDTFQLFRTPVINNRGEIAFLAGDFGHADEQLWVGSPPEVAIELRSGDEAPGTEPGVTFRQFRAEPVLNAQGEVAFLAKLRGPGVNWLNSVGLWVVRSNAVDLVARVGSWVPGAPPGQVLSYAPSSIYLNSQGTVAFDGEVAGSPGVWIMRVDEPPHCVALGGKSLEIAPGDVRTVAGADFSVPQGRSGNEDGRSTVLNDSGLLGFRAWFEDGATGLFVIDADNHAPVADAGVDQVLECSSGDGATVVLDGAGSSDPDSTPGTNDDIVLFEWYEHFGTTSERFIDTGQVVETTLERGEHLLTLRVTDGAGESHTDDTVVAVIDSEPPEISVRIEPRTLWPPNHRFVEVNVDARATDACNRASIILDSISVDDGIGDDRHQERRSHVRGAEFGTPDYRFELCASRAGNRDRRTYTVIYQATDEAGNRSTAVGHVRVPHDMRDRTQSGAP